MRQFTWVKKQFAARYHIYSNETECGTFKTRAFSRNCSGEINETAVEFITKGFFNTTTSIVKGSSGDTVGTITFNGWKSTAQLTVSGVEYKWKYDDFWHSKWSISNSEKVLMSFESKFFKGIINAEVYDPVLLLASLHVREHFNRRHAAAAAAAS